MYWSYCDVADFGEEDLQTASLSPSRKEYIHRLRRPEDKRRSVAAELLVQQLLREHYHITDAVLHRAENGRPYLTGCDLYVSIAHSDSKLACAVSEQPIGIDIEKIRPVNLNLLRHVCVEEEKNYVLGQYSGETECTDWTVLTRFFEVWTAKEAWFKKCGTGITDLKSVNVLSLSRQIHQTEDFIIQII